VHLEEPIKQLGQYQVPVRLHREVTAEITVEVVREE
jgi:large subunit ribosomal protein L9